MKALRCDAYKLQTRIAQLDAPVKIVSGRIDAEGGRYCYPYLKFRELAVQIGGQRFFIPRSPPSASDGSIAAAASGLQVPRIYVFEGA